MRRAAALLACAALGAPLGASAPMEAARGAWLGPGFLGEVRPVPDAPASVHPRSEAEYRVYFLYALALVTEWPEDALPKDPKAPFVIGILGQSELGPALGSLQARTVKGHPVSVVQSRQLEPLLGCHIVYITPSAAQDLPYVLKALRGRPILTVGDQENFTQLGGMVRCNPADGFLPSEVNVRTSREAGLGFRSRFLLMVSKVTY